MKVSMKHESDYRAAGGYWPGKQLEGANTDVLQEVRFHIQAILDEESARGKAMIISQHVYNLATELVKELAKI